MIIDGHSAELNGRAAISCTGLQSETEWNYYCRH